MEIIQECMRKARKDYCCDLCDETISAGESYFYQFNKDGGETWSFRSHDKCKFLMKELWAYIDPWDMMDSDYFKEGLHNFCKQFICPNCSEQKDGYWNNCKADMPYCLDKVYNLLQTHYLRCERNYANPIFIKWQLVDRSDK